MKAKCQRGIIPSGLVPDFKQIRRYLKEKEKRGETPEDVPSLTDKRNAGEEERKGEVDGEGGEINGTVFPSSIILVLYFND